MTRLSTALSVFVVISLFSSLLLGCAATREATPEQRESIRETVDHPFEKERAFDKAKRWAAQSFNSANEVIQEEDQERGTLVMKGIETITRAGVPVEVSYTLTLDIKEEKMRITFNPGEATNGSGLTEAGAKDLREFYSSTLRSSAVEAVRAKDDFFEEGNS